MAPAASVGPSRPSVPAASSDTAPGAPARARAAESASSWQRPPRPGAVSPSVTVVSPPQMRQRRACGHCSRGSWEPILQKCQRLHSFRPPTPPRRAAVLRAPRNEAQLCRPLGRSFEGQAVTRDQLERHACESRVPGFGVSGFRAVARPREPVAEPMSGMRSQSRARSRSLRTSRAVEGSGTQWPGADRGEVVADDVGDDVHPDARRGRARGRGGRRPSARTAFGSGSSR